MIENIDEFIINTDNKIEQAQINGRKYYYVTSMRFRDLEDMEIVREHYKNITLDFTVCPSGYYDMQLIIENKDMWA